MAAVKKQNKKKQKKNDTKKKQQQQHTRTSPAKMAGDTLRRSPCPVATRQLSLRLRSDVPLRRYSSAGHSSPICKRIYGRLGYAMAAMIIKKIFRKCVTFSVIKRCVSLDSTRYSINYRRKHK
jgi:hypothetical protein